MFNNVVISSSSLPFVLAVTDDNEGGVKDFTPRIINNDEVIVKRTVAAATTFEWNNMV